MEKNETTQDQLEKNCKKCVYTRYDKSIIDIYRIYCRVFNGFISFEESIDIYFPDFKDETENEQKFIIKQFSIISQETRNYYAAKQEAERRRIEIERKNQPTFRRRR